MKRWVFNIVIVIILSILVVGCTTVGAVNLPKDSKPREENSVDISPNDDETIKNEKNSVEEVADTESTEGLEVDKDVDKAEDVEKEEETPPKEIENKIHYSGDGSKKLVALTFDDGPESTYTSQVLEILEGYGIKATFFVVGQNAEKHPEVLKLIHDQGHEIGNHSWSHKYLPKLSKANVEKEVLMTERVIEEAIGEHAPLLRPPYGALKKQGIEQMSSLGYHVVNWSVDTRDWAGTSEEQMMNYVKKQLKPGGIILMHNAGNATSIKNTVSSLPTIIDWILEQGYEFVTVSEILDL